MFGLIRLVLGSLFFLLIVSVMKDRKVTNKRYRYVICVLVTIIIITMSAFIPLENAIYTFQTPEEAFNYYTFGNTDISLVVSGKDSDLVIGSKNNSDIYLIIPKRKDGWKVGIGLNTKKIWQTTIDDTIVYVHQYKNTNDYFVTVLDIKGNSLKVQDAFNSHFFEKEHKSTLESNTTRSYHANISNFSAEYWININGIIVSFEQRGTRGRFA